MREDHKLPSQRGSVTTEFIMILPLLALAMLLLMGLGYTVMTKQNAIVGARSAVFYRASLEDTPPAAAMNATIRNAVSPGREDWTLTFNETNMQNPDSGNGGLFQGAISGIYGSFNKEIKYTARGTATLGFLPSILALGQAEASYALPHRTWTCAQVGGSYTSVALGALGLPPPIPSAFSFSCCDTYESQNHEGHEAE